MAAHLEFGELGHKKFDFNRYNANMSGSIMLISPAFKCGTNGCAIGECPIVFPEDGWKFEFNGEPSYQGSIYQMTCASKFFEIDYEEAAFLFMPYSDRKSRYKIRMDGRTIYQLSYRATRYQVAERIKLFVEYKIRQEEKNQQ